MRNVGEAMTAAMRDQRDRDQQRVAWSDWLCFEHVDGVVVKRRLTVAENVAMGGLT